MTLAISLSTPAEVTRAELIMANYSVRITGLLAIFLILFCESIPLYLFYTKPFPNPDLSIDPNTSAISLNFTRKSVTMGGVITVVVSNPTFGFTVFFKNVSISVLYTDIDKATSEFLLSTDLPSMDVPGILSRAKYIRKFYAASTVNNTIGIGSRHANFFVRISAFMSFSGITRSYFNHPEGRQLVNVFCYPLKSNVTHNSINKATTVFLVGLAC